MKTLVSVCSILAVLAVSMTAFATAIGPGSTDPADAIVAVAAAPVTDPADATVAVEVVAADPEVAPIADVLVAVETVATDAVVVADAPVIPNLVVPQNPEQVGQQVVKAADNFATGSWIAGIVILIGIAIYFGNRFLGKKNDTTPKA